VENVFALAKNPTSTGSKTGRLNGFLTKFKLNANDRTQAATMAFRRGIISME
jgi:hypothetical protein